MMTYNDYIVPLTSDALRCRLVADGIKFTEVGEYKSLVLDGVERSPRV